MESKNQDHVSVLLEESIEALSIKENGIYVDATLGRAGHSLEILKKISNNGKLYAFDQDLEAIEMSNSKLSNISPRYELIHANYSNIDEELAKRNVKKVDGILFDLGVSSPQLDDGERGFSYNYDARLDMRMNTKQELDAYKVVNNYSEKELVRILFEFGEERFAKKIAQNIVNERKTSKIETTFQLIQIIKKSLPSFALRDGHPARRTFQAIRIEVNKELESLEIGLRKSLKLLEKQGRIVVITFHSLEDAIVKRIFNEVTKDESWNRNSPIKIEKKEIEFRLINKKVILPSEEEIKRNYRSHSAKLRIIEKI